MLSILALLSTFLLMPFLAQAQKYTVTIEPVEHATITAEYFDSLSKSFVKVKSGDQVPRMAGLNIMATPEAGFMVTHYVINGEEMESNGGSIRQYVEDNLTISARVAPATLHTVTITQPEHGTLKVTDGDKEVATGDKKYFGTRLSLELTPDTGYENEYWIVNGKKFLASTKASAKNKATLTVRGDVTVTSQLKVAGTKTMVPVTIVKPEYATVKAYKGRSTYAPELAAGEQLEAGSEILVVVTPDANHSVDYWLFNDQRVEKAYRRPNQQTFKIIEASTITPVLKEAGYKITYEQPAKGGTLSVTGGYPATDVPSGSRVKEGESLRISATVENGYQFKHFLINGKVKTVSNPKSPYTYEHANSDMTIAAVIEPDAPKPTDAKITMVQPEHGTMAASYYDKEDLETYDVMDGGRVNLGVDVTFVVTPKDGYEMDSWKVNDETKTLESADPNKLTLKVTGNLKVEPVLKAKAAPKPTEGKITIVQPKAEEGTMSVFTFDGTGDLAFIKDGQSVKIGTELTFKVKPKDGYEMDSWKVNDETKTLESADPNKLTLKVTGDLKVEPVLKKKAPVNPKKGTLTIKREGTGGNVEGKYLTPDGMKFSIWEGTKQIPLGSTVTLTAKITTEGFEVTYTNNGNPVPAEALSADGMVYTFTFNGDATVVATFAQKQVTGEFTVKCVADPEEGGKVSASTATGSITNETKVAANTYITVTATPNDNFEIDQWFLGDKEIKDKKGQASYTFALTEDVTVKVTFKSTLPPAEYAVTVEPVLPSAEAGTVHLFKKDGSVVASGKSVVEGTEMYVEVKPADKYELETLQVGETKIPAGDEKLVNIAGGGLKYTFTVTAATKVQATFKLANAVKQLAQSDVAVYVTNGGTRLEIAGAAEGAEVRLYDYTGQLLIASTEHALDISALPAGSYIVFVGNYTTRIVK